MTTKKFYKIIFPKLIVLLLFVFTIPGWMDLLNEYGFNGYYVGNYCLISLSFVILGAFLNSLIITISVICRAKVRDKGRVWFYLVILPYFSSILSSLIFFLLMKRSDPLNYRRISLYGSAVISIFITFFSSILIKKLRILDLIEEKKNDSELKKEE